MTTMRKLSKDSRLKKTLPLLGLLLLTTCATASSNACPSLRIYAEKEQIQLAAAISKLAPDNPLRAAMDDYDNLRRQVRACNGG